MKYVQLGNSEIKVSQLCVGCMSFGRTSEDFHQWTLNPQETETIVRKALDLGINFFDTANTYSHGTSEEYLGQALKKNIARDKAVIATKVYFNEGHLSKEAINREIDGSLKRLGTDYVDLYIIHRFDYDTPIEETMEALDRLVKSGKVRAHGWTKFVSMQNHYNLLYREDEREMIPVCRQYNVSLTPYSPLASGRLSRPEWHTDTKRSQTDKTAAQKYDSTEETDSRIVKRVAKIAEKYDATMSQISIAWLLAKGVTSPIIGATKARYFDDAAGALDISLSQEDVAYLEELYIPHKIVGAL